MPETDPTTGQEMTQDTVPVNNTATDEGTIQISVVSTIGEVPGENATVTISYSGDPGAPLKVLTTDNSGQTPVTELPAPPLELSLQPENEQQPYSEYNIEVTADGYEPVLISGSEIFAGEFSIQPVRMNPLASSEDEEKVVIIPVHTLFGEYPPKIPEDEIKPMAETGEIVLSRVVIPEYVIVHDGVPSDSTAPNYWVRYRDYIKNVASCEIYSTWPEAALYANILVIMSFTLNRVYTEWYRNQLFPVPFSQSAQLACFLLFTYHPITPCKVLQPYFKSYLNIPFLNLHSVNDGGKQHLLRRYIRIFNFHIPVGHPMY